MKIVLLETEHEAKNGLNNEHVEKLEDAGHEIARVVVEDVDKEALFITSPELDSIGIANITHKMKTIPETKVYSNWQNFFEREEIGGAK